MKMKQSDLICLEHKISAEWAWQKSKIGKFEETSGCLDDIGLSLAIGTFEELLVVYLNSQPQGMSFLLLLI